MRWQREIRSMPGNTVRLTMNFYFPVDARLRLKIR